MIKYGLLFLLITFGREAYLQDRGERPADSVYTEAIENFRRRPAVQRPLLPAEQPHWRFWLAAAIHQYTNAARSAQGRSPLEPAPALDSAAGHYARLLREQNHLSHRYPRAKWRQPSDRIAYWGGDYRRTAENLARLPLWDLGADGRYQVSENGHYQLPSGQAVENRTYLEMAQNVVQGWMDSKGHRANLLGPFTHLGLGLAQAAGKPPQMIIVQNFGKP